VREERRRAEREAEEAERKEREEKEREAERTREKRRREQGELLELEAGEARESEASESEKESEEDPLATLERVGDECREDEEVHGGESEREEEREIERLTRAEAKSVLAYYEKGIPELVRGLVGSKARKAKGEPASKKPKTGAEPVGTPQIKPAPSLIQAIERATELKAQKERRESAAKAKKDREERDREERREKERKEKLRKERAHLESPEHVQEEVLAREILIKTERE